MMKLMQRIHKLSEQSKADKYLLFQSVILVLFFRLAVIVLPKSKLHKLYTLRPLLKNTSKYISVAKIKLAVKRAGRLLKLKHGCLIKSLSMAYLLTKNNIPCSLIIGLAKDSTNALNAHAWVSLKEKSLQNHGVNNFKAIWKTVYC